MKPQYLYHCTEIYRGEQWIARKQFPLCVADKEPRTPRLCVCPTVAGCFAARLFVKKAPVHVYRTEHPMRGAQPVDVWDAPITGERWLFPPVAMVHVDVIPLEKVIDSQLEEFLFHLITRKSSDLKLRLAGYMRAMEVLGSKYNNYREGIIRKWYAEHVVESPERYILRRCEMEIRSDSGTST